ncbi:hypothetical protein MNBD_GAMMA20-257 [hydrothermal vent metagenome]|uniref:PilZ domain-containing protein n=1 Tax=hydrothermal vent metagenome TaxID=652676 RepID=A0A3B0ZNJ0_9ZZZZ
MTNFSDKPFREKRLFPRIVTQCQVLYRTPESKGWNVARLVDFSAIGMRIECDELLLLETPLSLQVKPCEDKVIPAISAEGRVVRCEPNADLRYEIACKLTKVSPA